MLHKMRLKKVRLGLVLLIGVLGVTLWPALAAGRTRLAPAAAPATLSDICTTGPTFNLETQTGHMQTPDGNSLFMWTFANSDAGGNFQVPSPVLCVNEGDTVTINLTNHLPEATSIIFPGQIGVTASGDAAGLFTAEANAAGGSASYTFTANRPGTYLYESGTDPHKQVEMGLYGALIVRPAMGANFAYNNASTEFEPGREFLLLIHDLDPALHQAVERNQTFDVTHRKDHYWTVNGRSFPDSIAPNHAPWLPHQPYGALVEVKADVDPNNLGRPALIRYINAGLENHPFHPHGNHMRVIGRDGRLLSLPYENFSTTIGAGQTYDLLFRWINVEQWGANGNPPRIRDQVTYPGLLNLVFKDGLTWFSGDPDLGVQADFPPGNTLLNECGEFYFPWHSHALNEFQNFDEGFGGLATLVRVDPPGSCGQ